MIIGLIIRQKSFFFEVLVNHTPSYKDDFNNHVNNYFCELWPQLIWKVLNETIDKKRQCFPTYWFKIDSTVILSIMLFVNMKHRKSS
jgi:hypothetical protein